MDEIDFSGLALLFYCSILLYSWLFTNFQEIFIYDFFIDFLKF